MQSFRKNIGLIMTIDDKIRHEKSQYYINREESKAKVLLPDKIDKFESINVLTGNETSPFDQSQMIRGAKFVHSPLGKFFKRQTKKTEDQGKKSSTKF